MKILIILAVLAFWAKASFSAEVNPYFFEVQKAGQTSYLLGTIHVGMSADELPSFILDKFKSSDVFVFESKEETNFSTPSSIPIAHFYPQDVLSLLHQRGLKNSLITYGDPRQLCQDYLFFEGLNTGKLLDYELQEMVIAKSKPRFELDDLDVQRNLWVDIFNSCHIEELVRELPPTKAKQKYLEFQNSYMTGELGFAEPDSEDESLNHISERNRSWIPKLEQILSKNKNVFVSIGFKHLGGKNGLLELLKNSGYSIKRIGPEKDSLNTQAWTNNGFNHVVINRMGPENFYSESDIKKATNFMDVTFIHFRNTPWTTEQILSHLRETTRIYNTDTCRVIIQNTYIVEADPYNGWTNVDWATIYAKPNEPTGQDLEISKHIPATARYPVIGLMDASAQMYTAWSAALFKVGSQSPLLNTIWAMSHINTPNYIKRLPKGYDPIAHELAHLLTDAGHNNFEKDNILHDDETKISDKILPEMCDQIAISPLVRHTP